MQSQDTVLLLLFARGDSRDVRVLGAKINFSSGQRMLWGPEQESKLTDSAVTGAGSTTHSLKGSTHSKLGVSRYLQMAAQA